MDIVTITDFSVSAENKVQVFIGGSLHGEERLGSHIAYYLIEYLVTNFNRDVYITHLLQTREIVVVPIPNAYGYAHKQWKERTVTDGSLRLVDRDPTRDFPYNIEPNRCLNTVAARSIY